jgi:hypothetical protein
MISVTGLYSIRGGTWHGLWYQRGAKNGRGTDDSTKELHRHGLSWGGRASAWRCRRGLVGLGFMSVVLATYEERIIGV